MRRSKFKTVHILHPLRTQSGEKMTQFGSRNESVSVLVEMPQSFNEIFGRVRRPPLGNSLIDWEEDFEADPLICGFIETVEDETDNAENLISFQVLL